MDKPQHPGFAPSEYQYRAYTKRNYIYWCRESLLDEEFEDDERTPRYSERDKLKSKDANKTTLQDLLDLLPEGVKPQDVKLDFGYNANSCSYEDHYVGLYWEEKIPARKKEYQADLKAHKEKIAEYEKAEKKYQEWRRQEEIRETEEKLKKLREQ